jgi:hypothetical protein
MLGGFSSRIIERKILQIDLKTLRSGNMWEEAGRASALAALHRSLWATDEAVLCASREGRVACFIQGCWRKIPITLKPPFLGLAGVNER